MALGARSESSLVRETEDGVWCVFHPKGIAWSRFRATPFDGEILRPLTGTR